MRAAALAVIVAALALAACGDENDGGDGADGGSSGAKSVRLAVGIDSVYAPMFLAQEEGIFEKHGLDVQVQQFAQGGEGLDALLAGAMDTAGTTDSNLLQRAGRGDLRSLGAYVEDEGNYVKLVTRKEIDDPSEIRKLGVIPGQISEYGARKMLQSEGIDAESVEFVEVGGPPEMGPLLQRGDVDAFVLNEPWPTRAVELGGKVLQKAKEFDLSYTLGISSTPEWLESHQEEAKALMSAMAEAARRTEEDPEAAAAATEKLAKVPRQQTLDAVRDLTFGVRDFDQDDLERLSEVGDFLLEQKLIDAEPRPEEVFGSASDYVPKG